MCECETMAAKDALIESLIHALRQTAHRAAYMHHSGSIEECESYADHNWASFLSRAGKDILKIKQ